MTGLALALLATTALTQPSQAQADPARNIPVQTSPMDQVDPAKLPAPARALTEAPEPALVAPHPRHAKGDPLEGLNRGIFKFNAKLDHAIFRPAAMGYKHVIPRFVRSGLRNFFSNLTEPIVFLNDLLQLKPGRAAKTLVRFAVNSTAGFAGLADPARLKPLNIRHHDNGFGSTLGRYGVGPGPYIYLPLAGPTTLRDLLGSQADRLVLPFTVHQPPFDRYEYQIPKAVITGLDARAEADDELKALFSGAVDPYATLRSVFLQNRAGEIAALRGRRDSAAMPADVLDDPLRDPSTTPASDAPELKDTLSDPAAPKPTAPAPDRPASSTARELQDPLSDPAAPAKPSPADPSPAAPAAPARK